MLESHLGVVHTGNWIHSVALCWSPSMPQCYSVLKVHIFRVEWDAVWSDAHIVSRIHSKQAAQSYWIHREVRSLDYFVELDANEMPLIYGNDYRIFMIHEWITSWVDMRQQETCIVYDECFLLLLDRRIIADNWTVLLYWPACHSS